MGGEQIAFCNLPQDQTNLTLTDNLTCRETLAPPLIHELGGEPGMMFTVS